MSEVRAAPSEQRDARRVRSYTRDNFMPHRRIAEHECRRIPIENPPYIQPIRYGISLPSGKIAYIERKGPGETELDA